MSSQEAAAGVVSTDGIGSVFFRVVELLRRLGQSCIGQVLGGPAPQVAALLELRPFVAPWCSTAEREQLRHRVLRLLRYTSSGIDRMTDPLAITMARLLDRQHRSGQPGRTKHSTSPLPEQLWPVAAELAWRQPGFRHQLGSQLQSFFRSHLLIGDGKLPTISLDLRTYWLLLELAGMARLRHLATITKPKDAPTAALVRDPRSRQAVTRLSELAVAGLAGARWAGFWDQWVMLEAARKNQRHLGQTTPAILHLLASLPWLEEMPQRPTLHRPAPASSQHQEIAVASWRQDRPVWLLGDTIG